VVFGFLRDQIKEDLTLIDKISDPFLFLASCFYQLGELQNREYKDAGNLVHLTCGHKGRPKRHEERMISRLLKRQGFIRQPASTSDYTG